MIEALDHIVILVDDLAAATADYAQLGFKVVPGGTHTDGATHNALVSFADGSYLELLAFLRPAENHGWWRHTAAGEGLIDFALLPGAIGEDVSNARERGLAIKGPFDGGRARPDGVELKWQTARAERQELPFLCGDVTPRELRVPGEDTWTHPNGVRGIAGVTVAVHDLEASARAYAALLGRLPVVEPGRRRFELRATQIILRTPASNEPDDSALEAHLQTRGEGIYGLQFQVIPKRSGALLDLRQSHGVRATV
ncbi:MAG: VOC family protein [Oscillochloris sp.]|nr:VOC family protein [Oscillochloris sp.]